MQGGSALYLFSALALEFFKDDGRIVPTEPKRIAQHCPDLSFLCGIEREVQARVDFRIICEVVDGRWDKAVVDGQHPGNRLYGTRCAQQVAGHRLGRTYVEAVGMIAKYFLDGLCLCDVAQWGRGAVHIDIVYGIRG